MRGIAEPFLDKPGEGRVLPGKRAVAEEAMKHLDSEIVAGDDDPRLPGGDGLAEQVEELAETARRLGDRPYRPR